MRFPALFLTAALSAAIGPDRDRSNPGTWYVLPTPAPRATATAAAAAAAAELLKGSAIKFWLGATATTVNAHTKMQANIRAWARTRKS